jgi:adenosine deaminase
MHGLSIQDTGRLRELVQIGDDEEFTFENFLSKFQTLRLFYRSPDVIERITQEAIQDAAADNIRYMELRFTPVALSRAESFPLAQVMDWVAEAAASAASGFGVKTRLIASVNRHEGPEVAREVARLAARRIDKGFVGLDLAGNEADFSGMQFIGVFKEAKQAGLKITVHAGEWGGAENILDAILYLSADRVGHGARLLDNPDIADLAMQRKIPLEICVTSNLQSGVFSKLENHPIMQMVSSGLNVTINTDDPSISKITLSDEYRVVCNELGMTPETLRQRILAAAGAAFLPRGEKQELMVRLENELANSVHQ